MIKKFEEFINEGIIMKTIKRSLGNGIRKEDDPTQLIHDFMDKHNITDYTINPDKSVDINDDIKIKKEDLINKKLPFKFNKVNGDFSIAGLDLDILENCPEEVGGDFYCDSNQLTSLEGCPDKIYGEFICYKNQLTSLEGCPKKVGGEFHCYNNKKQFTEEEVKQYCKVKSDIYV